MGHGASWMLKGLAQCAIHGGFTGPRPGITFLEEVGVKALDCSIIYKTEK